MRRKKKGKTNSIKCWGYIVLIKWKFHCYKPKAWMPSCVIIHRVSDNGSVHIFSSERCTVWFLTGTTLIKLISNFLFLYTNTIYYMLYITCQIFPFQRSSFDCIYFAVFNISVMHISQTHLYFFIHFTLKFPFPFSSIFLFAQYVSFPSVI